jgi:hypothetical protein
LPICHFNHKMPEEFGNICDVVCRKISVFDGLKHQTSVNQRQNLFLPLRFFQNANRNFISSLKSKENAILNHIPPLWTLLNFAKLVQVTWALYRPLKTFWNGRISIY